MNQLQMGLFFDESSVDIALSESGSWNCPCFNLAEYQNLVVQARANVSRVPLDLLPYFLLGVESSEQSISQGSTPEDRPSQWRAVAHFNDSTWLGLNAVATPGLGSGAECKVRTAPRSKVIGVYVEGVGSLIVHGWVSTGDCRYWAEFLPWRSCFFRPSFRDAVSVISEAYSSWENVVSCMQFSSAGDKVPSVPTVKVKGREYVVTSAVYSRKYREGEAWGFVRLCDWAGPSFTYDQNIKEMEAGRKERGDQRGTLAKIRGEICVLSEMVILADHSVL
ncbi:hypothetical protein [Pseudomonas sp. W5-01]|uniref:hypothetical protein n=1 Tax=Pseudomonas sp. W5-01 TaxID=3097454 RepID=UPI00397CD8B1